MTSHSHVPMKILKIITSTKRLRLKNAVAHLAMKDCLAKIVHRDITEILMVHTEDIAFLVIVMDIRQRAIVILEFAMIVNITQLEVK
jgi:hypothetical protein